MELQHVNIKIFAEDRERVEQEKFTPIFQQWIQDQVCEELLIDVADYLHVDAGPGIVLVGHEADYSMDDSDHRLGLRYNHKAVLPGSNSDRFKQALKSAILACRRLEAAPLMKGRLKFNRQEIVLFINDRALAPNTEATWKEHRGEIENFFKPLLENNKFDLEHDADPRVRFGVQLTTAKPMDFEKILKYL